MYRMFDSIIRALEEFYIKLLLVQLKQLKSNSIKRIYKLKIFVYDSHRLFQYPQFSGGNFWLLTPTSIGHQRRTREEDVLVD